MTNDLVRKRSYVHILSFAKLANLCVNEKIYELRNNN